MLFSRLSLALNKEQLMGSCKNLIHTSCRSESSYVCLCRLDKWRHDFQDYKLIAKMLFCLVLCPTLSKEEVLNVCQHNIWDESAPMIAYIKIILSLMRLGKIDHVRRTKNLTVVRVGFL